MTDLRVWLSRSADEMIRIRPTRLHWIKDDGIDDPRDYCAHSPIEIIVNGKAVVESGAESWTVSASAILLLRSIFRDHPADMKEEEHIFPCCGHFVIPHGTEKVDIAGCPNGIDFPIIHTERKSVRLEFPDEVFEIPEFEWISEVSRFSDLVMRFYTDSREKEFTDDWDCDGFLVMMSEWKDLRNKAEQVGMRRRKENSSADE